MSAAWVEAVKAVAHSDNCRSLSPCSADEAEGGVGECDCDRDTRIAKGIEAAMDVVEASTYHLWTIAEWEPRALAAFKEAAR